MNPKLTSLTPIFRTPMGDPVYHYEDSMVIALEGSRGVCSTANLNGGYRQDLRYIFNNSCGNNPLIKQKICPGIKGRDIVEHYFIVAEELGLDGSLSTGMGTAALIENHAVVSQKIHEVEVMAIATAGIDVNGGRAGDEATFNEFTNTNLLPPPGTINIILLINAKLSAGALSRAMMTATEAKTAALQELMAGSNYSTGLATGSGTDCLIAVCNDEADTELLFTGKHVLLGQMIGQTVKEAVKKALANQTGMTPDRQASIHWQGKRYGITKEQLYNLIQSEGYDWDEAHLDHMLKNSQLVALVAMVFHLLDQWQWGIVAEAALRRWVDELLSEDHLLEAMVFYEEIDRFAAHTRELSMSVLSPKDYVLLRLKYFLLAMYTVE